MNIKFSIHLRNIEYSIIKSQIPYCTIFTKNKRFKKSDTENSLNRTAIFINS